MRYEDFVIRFSPGPGGAYGVQVESPQGSGRGSFAPPAWGAGAELFQSLFQREVSRLFERSLGEMSSRGDGLRILLEVDPRQPELAPIQILPWETLYDPETGDFLALSGKTPVARSLRVPRKSRPTRLQEKGLRILALAASPAGSPPLDLERERRNLEKAWKGPIVPLRKTDREEIHRIFRKAPVHVLHYMGHGSFDIATGEGMLLLEGKDGAVPVSGRALAEDLKRFPDLRLVVLNACHTARSVGDAGPNPFAGVATALVMGGVPAVIAMRQPISDPAAVAFSQALYERLAAGDPVEAAMTEARLAIHRLDEKSGEWATPVLFLRDSQGPVLTVRRVSFLAAALVASVVALFSGLGWFQDLRASGALRHSNEGIELLEAWRNEEAREAFLAALKIDPDHAVAHANLSILEESRGNYEESLMHARAAVEAEPGEAVYHYNLGNLLARLGRGEEAIESLREALRLKPDFGEAYNEIGNVYLDLDRPADARRELEAGLRAAPGLASLHKNLARVDLAEGRIDEAIRGLETALSLYGPENRQGIAEASYWLAAAHARAGRTDEACQWLEEVRPEAGAGHWVSEAGRLAQQIPCRRVS